MFQVKDLLYLWLQPCRHTFSKKKGAKKLQPRFYGPYKIIKKVGEVAYELDLPANYKIHNVFHVSCLKKEIGKLKVVSKELPPLDDEVHLALVPEKVLMGRERKSRNTWYSGKDFPVKMPLGRVSRSYSTLLCFYLRTSIFGRRGLPCPINLTIKSVDHVEVPRGSN